MNLQQFADKYHGRTRRDECGETIIPGRIWKKQPKPGRIYGHQIYEHGGGRFGVLLMFETPRKWTNAKMKLSAAGLTIHQDGEVDGIALFDPGNDAHARLAFKIAGVRLRRQLSPEKRQELAERLKLARAA